MKIELFKNKFIISIFLPFSNTCYLSNQTKIGRAGLKNKGDVKVCKMMIEPEQIVAWVIRLLVMKLKHAEPLGQIFVNLIIYVKAKRSLGYVRNLSLL